MKNKNSIELLEQLKIYTDKNIKNLNRYLENFVTNQLNWKPSGEIWSINENLAHLNSYANYYHQEILNTIQKTKYINPKEEFSSSALGRSTYLSVKLGKLQNVKRKLKTRNEHNPTLHSELTYPNSYEIFLRTQHVLKDLLEKSKSVNLRRVKILTSTKNIIKLRLGDVFLFLIYHNERHIEQINKLTKHVHFPQK